MINNSTNKVTENEYGMFMSVMPVSVSKHLMDAHFTVLWANDAYYQLTGYEKEEYISLFHNHLDEYYHGDPSTVNTIAAAIQDACLRSVSGFELECRMPVKNGMSLWVRITGRITGEPLNSPPSIYMTYTDITALKERQSGLEAALHTAEQANRAKSDFLSRMSHDIRTPMNAIIGMTEIASNHLQNPAKLSDCLKKISLSSQHLLSLINDVLDISKIESGNMLPDIGPMFLPELIENVVTIIYPEIRGRRQEFSIHLDGICHEHFYSDTLRLRQVFINILSNACKFTPKGGSITLTIAEQPLTQPETALLTFTFADTGIGMHPDFVSRIFDAFTREQGTAANKPEGTGLGMTISKRIIDMLNGTIQVESQPENGSVFTVRIPLKVNCQAVKPDTSQLTGKRLLAAVGDRCAGRHLLRLLRACGIAADQAFDEETTVTMIAEAHRSQTDYDAVILDWNLPGSGCTAAAERIRASQPENTPPLLVCAYDWADIEKGAKGSAFQGFLQKPFFYSTLVSGLKKYLVDQVLAGYEPAVTGSVDFSGKRFLLIEDNQLNREIAQELLSSTGAAIESACDGKSGLDKFLSSREGYYDLILMDIQMPVMDGYTAARAIRSQSRKDAQTIPILAMTADAFTEDIEAAKKAGMDGHLAKPFYMTSMTRRIAEHLDRSAAACRSDK